MIRYLFLLFYFFASLSASQVVNFKNPKKNKNKTFFLSTPKSGSNLICGCLSAITRKPISWFYWGKKILDPLSAHRTHISYNRLDLRLITNTPLLYRTHYEFTELMKVPSRKNKLIFATRNPKELLYRKFLLQGSSSENPDSEFIEEFLDKYIKAFKVYDSWHPANRKLIFYEDFIKNKDDTLILTLEFMKEKPLFLEDFLENKQYYLSKLLDSYASQHTHNFGGKSSHGGSKAIYYTKKASVKTLQYIDQYLKKTAPDIYKKYLTRFKVSVSNHNL